MPMPRNGLTEAELKEVEAAFKSDPSGITCSKCGGLNLCADDCGWWYDPRPVCHNCWENPLGDR